MNDFEIRRLGEALRRSEKRHPLGTESQCDPGELWDLIEGKLGPEQVRKLADAAIENPELAEDWHLALEIRKARDRQSGLHRRGFRTHSWMAIAAIVVLALLSPLLVQHFRSTPVLRGVSTTEIHALNGENALLARNHFLLRWSDPSEKTVSWDIVVMKANLEEINEKSGLKHPEFQVPAEALADLKPGDRVLWQVGSTDRDGTRSVSKTFVVKLGKEQ